MSEYFQALILGLVEGITEFLPVSSTGHLVLLSTWLGFEAEGAGSFKVFIQLGAVSAVVILYWRRYLALLDFQSDSKLSGKNGILRIIIGCFPAALCGALFHSKIKETFLETASPLAASALVASALFVGGLVLIFVERFRAKKEVSIENLSVKQAFMVGLFQILALWPGMSRSGSTIVGGMLIGLSRKDAAEFSFLLAAPIMFGAVAFDLLKDWGSLSGADPITFGIGFVVAFVSGAAAMHYLIRYISHNSLAIFGYYRLLLAAVVLAIVL